MVNIKTKTTMVARARMNNPDPNSILRNGENIGKKILFTQSFDAKLADCISNNPTRKLRQEKPTTTLAQLTPHWFGDIAPVRNKFV
jgi:hypothetical protein